MAEDYLDMDFESFKNSMIDILQDSQTFKDYNFEGSNISVLLELMAYQLELNTFYLNKIAKNVYLDSADVYSTIHRLAKQKGYSPKGYLSAYTTLTIEVTGGCSPGDELYIPAYSKFLTEDNLPFITTRDYTFNIPTSASDNYYQFEIGVKEGALETLNFTGEDLIDYELILPEQNYDHDDNITNNEESIKVHVNNDKWIRLTNFYENLSGLSMDENVYMFDYTKNRQYTISFTPTRNFPKDTDQIEVQCILSSGENGRIGSNIITTAEIPFIDNITNNETIPLENVNITNPSASLNGSNPETVDTIKRNAKIFNSQYRCVTKEDYISHIETLPSVMTASVWGEKEEALNGDVQEYNKVHITVIPENWINDTISLSTSGWMPYDDEEFDIQIPDTFSNSFKNDISLHIEPRKLLNTYEVYELPELVYFYFELGLKSLPRYNFSNVARDVRNKILYYFHPTNRRFNEIIDFREITEFIEDTSNISPNDSFPNIKGIKSLVFREINLNHSVYSYESEMFPRYEQEDFDIYVDNILRPIKLGYNQFPSINSNLIKIGNEG